MNDPDDEKLKAEIDEIMMNINNVMKKSKTLIRIQVMNQNKMRTDVR